MCKMKIRSRATSLGYVEGLCVPAARGWTWRVRGRESVARQNRKSGCASGRAGSLGSATKRLRFTMLRFTLHGKQRLQLYIYVYDTHKPSRICSRVYCIYVSTIVSCRCSVSSYWSTEHGGEGSRSCLVMWSLPATATTTFGLLALS